MKYATLTIDAASTESTVTLSGLRPDLRWCEDHKYQEVVVMTKEEFERLRPDTERMRWPGYAIEGGRLYESGGVVEGVQQWREIERLSKSAVLALLAWDHRDSTGWAYPSDGEVVS